MDMFFLTPDAFRPTVGTIWKVALQGTEIDLALLSIREGWEMPIRRGLSFSLVFKGPAQPALPSAPYTLKHPKLGVLPMVLISPILPHPNNPQEMAPGMLYEVVFS